MTDDDDDGLEQQIADAQADAARFRFKARVWRVAMVVISAIYWFISKEPYAERAIIVLIAALSIHALVLTEEGKEQAALSRAAGYEHP